MSTHAVQRRLIGGIQSAVTLGPHAKPRSRRHIRPCRHERERPALCFIRVRAIPILTGEFLFRRGTDSDVDAVSLRRCAAIIHLERREHREMILACRAYDLRPSAFRAGCTWRDRGAAGNGSGSVCRNLRADAKWRGAVTAVKPYAQERRKARPVARVASRKARARRNVERKGPRLRRTVKPRCRAIACRATA